jgi:hypothetical protein
MTARTVCPSARSNAPDAGLIYTKLGIVNMKQIKSDRPRSALNLTLNQAQVVAVYIRQHSAATPPHTSRFHFPTLVSSATIA